MQLLVLLIPLLTLPYLLKTLGKDLYGLIVFAQAIVAYFVIFINFGFNLAATKEVSKYRDNKKKLSEVVSSIFILKGLLFIISFILFFCIISFIPRAEGEEFVFLLTMHLCLYEWLCPIWYFQGIEKMKYITFINLASRIVFLGLLFFVIKDSTDYVFVPLLNSFGTGIAIIISIWIVFWNNGVNFKWQSRNRLFYYLQKSFPFFISRISIVINNKTNILIIGSLFSLADVALYDIAMKISELGKIPLNMINQVVYPRIALTKDMVLARTVIILSFLIGVFIYLFILIFGIEVLQFFGGHQFTAARNILFILGLVIPILGISYNLGNCVLIVMNKSFQFNMSVYLGTLIYFFSIAILYFSNNIDIIRLSVLIVFVQFFILLYRIYFSYTFLKKQKI